MSDPVLTEDGFIATVMLLGHVLKPRDLAELGHYGEGDYSVWCSRCQRQIFSVPFGNLCGLIPCVPRR